VYPADTVGVTGVANLWRSGATGQGVDVALIDSGVAPVSGLSGGQVVQGPDLSFESQAGNLAHLDTFGHGTHMASIIVGHDGSVDPARSSTWHNGYSGVAPGARLISIKVADATGATDVTQVIAAIDWVVQHRNTDGLNIRVLNLSLGTDSTQSYVVDPLAHAAEAAWRNGIAVVVAAGNGGTSKTGLTDPAYDPYVIAVGAGDVTPGSSSSRIRPASFTQQGDGTRNPDLLAPGTHIVGLRDPGSFVDANNPGGRSGSRYFLGSGTSQASAYMSGTVADLLSARPDLTPDDVKGVLRGTAKPVRNVSSTIQGAGVLHVQSALSRSMTTSQRWQQSTGGGALEAARGSYHVVHDNQQLTGERDIFGQPVDTGALAAAEEQGSTWSGGNWNGSTWSGSTWSGSTWSTVAWAGSTWSGSTWSGSTWSGSTWSGSTWSGSTWSGSTWSGSTWSGSTWSGSTWSASDWS
jgi:serine protease AprX